MGKKASGAKSPGGGAGASGTISKKPSGHSMSTVGRGKGSQSVRSAATVRRLMMYKQKPVRDKKGKVLKQDLQSKELPSTRIVPDRRWFGNTRVIGQKALDEFREDMANKSKDGYTVLIKQKKLPLSLLADPEKGRTRRVNLLGNAPFNETFSAGRRQKRPKLATDDLSALAARAAACGEAYGDGIARGPIERPRVPALRSVAVGPPARADLEPAAVDRELEARRRHLGHERAERAVDRRVRPVEV